MKRIVIALSLAAAFLMAACSPKSGNTTKVVGQFAENAPETVRLVRGYYDGLFDEDHFVSFFDTTVAVVNGRFEVEIPKCLTTMTDLQVENGFVGFISDGSTITIDPEARTAVSSDEDGAHSRYMDFARRWDDYQTRMAGFGSDVEAMEKYRNENLGTLLDYTKEAARNNPDNFVGLQALEMFYFSTMGEQDTDAEEMLALLDGLSDEIKTDPMSSVMFTELVSIYSGLANTKAGQPFVDFTVEHVLDENPDGTLVTEQRKLSDYVGKGKYILVDFWSPWCPPCKAELPNIVNVYNKYHGDKFDILSVAVWEESRGMNWKDTRDTAVVYGITWNQMNNGHQEPAALYGIEGIPHVILFGPDGTILKRDLRSEQIGEAVKEALGL